MSKSTMRRSARVAAVFGATLASAFWGLGGTSHASDKLVRHDAFYQIMPLHTGGVTCLDVANISEAHGADVVQGRCWQGWNQHWRIERAFGPWFRITPRHADNKCLDVANQSTAHTADVIQGTCYGGSNQLWRFVVVRNGNLEQATADGRPEVDQFVQIRAMHSDKCLDVAHISQAHDADVIQGGCVNGPNQLWRFVPEGVRG